MSTQIGTKVIDIVSKRYVTEGPHLWVSRLLYSKGCLSSKKIWEEFLKDQTTSKELIKSRSFLKTQILYQMLMQGKVVRGKAMDIPKWNKSGWLVVPNKAFENAAPDLLATLEPLPQIQREDYKKYLTENNVPFNF